MTSSFLDQAITVDFAFKLTAAALLFLSYSGNKDKMFAWWSLGWLFFAIQAFLDHLLIYVKSNPLWLIRNIIWPLAAVFFFYGICLFAKKKGCLRYSGNYCRVLVLIFTILSFFSAYIGIYLYNSWLISALSISILTGCLLLISAYYYYHIVIDRKAIYNRLIVVGFILNGVHDLDYFLLRPVEWFAPYGYLLGAIFSLIFAFGMILKSKIEALHIRRINLNRLREVATLYSVTSTVCHGRELDQILYSVLDNLIKILRLDGGIIFFLNQQTGNLILKAHRGVSEKLVKSLSKLSSTQKGATITAIKENRIVFVPDVSKADLALKDDLLQEGIYSFAAIPLRSGSKVLGAIDVGTRRPHRFNSEDMRLLESIGDELGIAVENKQLIEDLDKAYLSTILALTDIVEAKDHYTRSHSSDVTRYATAIAKEMNLPAAEIEKIQLAAQLHDLGKLSISDKTLLKPGKLTKREWNEIKRHPEKAVQILKPLTFLHKGNGALDYIRSHHERYDGEGYPNGYKECQIKLGARILSVADAYSAMISSRPYRKKPLTEQQAMEELKRNSGSQFDPKVVEAFLKVLEREKEKKERY